MTRSRPYHSDDNAHVEQKNWTWPRQLLGYGRLESETLLCPINALYTEAWGPLHNFFLPSMKLVAKWREGSRWGDGMMRPRRPISASWLMETCRARRAESYGIAMSRWIRLCWRRRWSAG